MLITRFNYILNYTLKIKLDHYTQTRLNILRSTGCCIKVKYGLHKKTQIRMDTLKKEQPCLVKEILD